MASGVRAGSVAGGPTTSETAVGDGTNPNGGLVFDSAGNLYGTTYQGGMAIGGCDGGVGGTGCGTVFELSPPKAPGGSWTERVLYRFGPEEGSNPAAGVVSDPAGNLYGTTYFSSQNSFGSVFELRKPGHEFEPWSETALVLFNGTNGEYPDAGLTFDGTGALYGSAIGSSHGEVYRLASTSSNQGSWTVDVLYEFTGSSGGHPDAPLVFDKAGNIYSTTEWGGAGEGCGFAGCGVVYEVSP